MNYVHIQNLYFLIPVPFLLWGQWGYLESVSLIELPEVELSLKTRSSSEGL